MIRRYGLALASLLGVSVLVMVLSLVIGSVAIPPSDVMAVFLGQGDTLHHTLIMELRLPRTLTGFATGGLLAMAGALMQVLLRNPLADPYVLGISGGASVGALLMMLFGMAQLWIPPAAFCGALIAMLLVFGLAQQGGSWTPTRLLLTGVVIAAGWGAVITLMLATSPAQRLPGMLYWLMGDLTHAGSPLLGWLVLVPACAVALSLGRSLNVLARGGQQAAALGLNVRQLEWLVYIVASLLTAVAVSLAGSVGFVGLIVPHLLRLLLGNDQRVILPASVLGGGSLLVGADLLARTLLAPQQLPVGVITALLGVPIFLILLSRSR